MLETQKCNTCKKTLKKNLFTVKNKIFKVCNNCRKQLNEKRRKNICEDCGIRAIFNMSDKKNGIKCKKHMEPGMVNVISSKCVKCKKKRPYFNVEGENKALYCKDCAEPDMIDVKNPKCIKCKTKRPNFNVEGENKALYCKDCAEPGMVDINHLKCVKCKKKRPSFNVEGEIKALYCKDCAEPGMVDIKIPKCMKCKVKKPYFNVEGENKALYCKDCAEPDMIDVKNPKCIKCKTKRPTFNIQGEIKALYCKDCAEPDMVDINSSKCIKCDTRASFGYINQKKTHCAKHKLSLMFKKTKPICNAKDCLDIAEYGINEPTHCFIHKLNNELCLLGKKCKKCNRENEICNNDGLCLTYCRPVEIDLNIKKIIKKKEALVLSYLDKHVKLNINPIDDKIIDNSCVKNRPDRVYDCGSHFVVLEVDENQHKSYTNGCSYDIKVQEQRRMVQIHEALSKGMIPVIFIRFNPDNFRVKDKIQKINMQKRLDMLVKWLKKCVDVDIFSFTELLLIKHLYYDEYEESNVNFEKIEDISKLI